MKSSRSEGANSVVRRMQVEKIRPETSQIMAEVEGPRWAAVRDDVFLGREMRALLKLVMRQTIRMLEVSRAQLASVEVSEATAMGSLGLA